MTFHTMMLNSKLGTTDISLIQWRCRVIFVQRENCANYT